MLVFVELYGRAWIMYAVTDRFSSVSTRCLLLSWFIFRFVWFRFDHQLALWVCTFLTYFNILLYLFLKWFQIQEGENLSTFSTSIVFPNDAFLPPRSIKIETNLLTKETFYRLYAQYRRHTFSQPDSLFADANGIKVRREETDKEVRR